MEFEATEIQEFNIYLKVAKVLLHDLDNITDQTKAAQWVQTLGPGFPARKYQTRLMLSYMKLLVCALLRKKLVEPFTSSPGTYLDESYGNLKLTDMWLTVSKNAWLARSGGGEPSPCHVEVSGDRQQYACVQRAPDGAQCYFAISAAQKLERWNNASKAHLPKVYKTAKSELPPLPELKPLPDNTLLEQKLTQKDIQKAKDVLKRIKDRDAKKKDLGSPPPTEVGDIPVTPPRRYSLPWDKIEAGILPTMSPSDPEYVDMSREKYPAGYIQDFPPKGGSMDWGRRRKYVQKPFSLEKSSVDERPVLENITEASVVEPTLGDISDLTHISGEELSFYDSFRDNLEDSQRKHVAFGDAKLHVPFDSMQGDMPEYRRPLSRISEKSESSIPRESLSQLVQSPYTPTFPGTPTFPDTPSLSHLQTSPGTPGPFGSPGSLRSTPRSIRPPSFLPRAPGSLAHTPGSLPSTPGSYYPDSPGMLPYTPRQRQDESMRRTLMRERMDSTQGSLDDSGNFYKKLGYSSIGAYLDGILPETAAVPVVQQSPVADIPHDERAKFASQADHLAALENMVAVPETPVRDSYAPQVQEQQQPAHEGARGLTPQLSTSAISPRDRASRRTRPTTLSSPALFRRGMGGRDREYRPSEFGLTGQEHWTPAELYFRGSIEPIFDPDERAVDRIIRFLDDSMLEDEGMDFSSVLEDSVPDWERPSWPGLPLTIPPMRTDQEVPTPISPRNPSRAGTYPDFIPNGLPGDTLDPDDKPFSLSDLNTSVFDNLLENDPRIDPRTLFQRQEISDYENLEDETPLDIPIANASLDSSTSDQSEIPSHLWASELHRLQSTWQNLQRNSSNQLQDESFPHSEFIETSTSIDGSLDRSHLHFQDESFPHSQFIESLPSISQSVDRSHLQFQDESFPHSEFIQTLSSISGSPDGPQFQDESFPHSEFIQTSSSIGGSLNRSHLQFQDESFPHSQFIQTLPSISESVNRSHRQFQDESFPHSEFIQTLPSISGSHDGSQFQDESFPHSEFIQTSSSIGGSIDRSHLQFQDESFPHSQFIQTSSSIAQSPDRPNYYSSPYRRQSQSSGAIKERVLSPRRSLSAPVKVTGSMTQTDYGLDAQWDRLLQISQINIDEEELPSFQSITEDSLPQNEINFNVSEGFIRDIESRLVPESPLLPEIFEPGIDDLTAISLVLEDSTTLTDKTFANSTMISATSPPQFYSVDESFPTNLSSANTSMISSTSFPKLLSSFEDESYSSKRIHGTPESAKKYIPPPFTLPSPRRVEVKKQQRIPLPSTKSTPTRFTVLGSGQEGSQNRERRRQIPRSQIRPKRLTFEETASSLGKSPSVRMLEDESDLQFVDDFSYAPSIEMRTPDSAKRLSISPRVHASSDLRYDLELPDMSGELLDDITAPSFRLNESSGLPNESMLSAETPPMYSSYIDRSVSGNISTESPPMLSSYNEEYTPEMISMETPPSFTSYDDNSILQYSGNRADVSMPGSRPPRRRTYEREHTLTSPVTPGYRRAPVLIHRTPESAKQYIPLPFSLPSLVRYEQPKPYRTFAAPDHSTPKDMMFSPFVTRTRPRRDQFTIVPRRLQFSQEGSTFSEPATRISALEDESQPEFAVSYDESSMNMDSRSLPDFAPNYIQYSGIKSNRELADQNDTQMLENETAPDFAISFDQSSVGSGNRRHGNAVLSTNQSNRGYRRQFSVPDLSLKQMLEDETAPDFVSTFDQSTSFDQRGPLSLPDERSYQNLEEETMPSFPSSYYDQSTSFDQRRRLSLPDQSSSQMLQDETMPTFPSSYYDQSTSYDGRRRLSLPDLSSSQMLQDETMPTFPSSYYDQSTSFDRRRRLSLPDQSSVQMLDEETMPSFSGSYYDQSTSFDRRRRPLLPDESSVSMLDEETMPSFSDSYYDQSTSFKRRRRPSLPDQSFVRMLDEETMPSFSGSYYDQSTSFDRRRRPSAPDESSVRMLDEETMPSFPGSYYDQSTSFDRRRRPSAPDESSVRMLDEETMPSFSGSYYDQSTSFDRRRRLSLPDEASVQMLDDETMPSFSGSYYDQSTSFDRRTRPSLPDQSSVRMLDEETMPSFSGSYYDQSTSFDRRRRPSLPDETSVQMLDDETMPSFAASYYDQSTSFDRRRRPFLADQSSVRMLDDETMPSFSGSYYDQSTSFDRRRRPSLPNQSSVRMLDEETMPSFATSYNQSRNQLRDSQESPFTLPDQGYVPMLEDETAPDLVSSYEQSSCGNKSCRENNSGTQMLEDESQPDFNSTYSQSFSGFIDSSQNNANILINQGRDRRRRLSPTTYEASLRQIRDSPIQMNYPSLTGEQLNDITPPSLYMEHSVTIPDNSMISNESPYYFSSFDSSTPSRETYNNMMQRSNQTVRSTPKTPDSFRKYARPPFTLPSQVRIQTPERRRVIEYTSTPRNRTTSPRTTQTRRVNRNGFPSPQLLETNERLLQDETDPNLETTFDSDRPFEYGQRTHFIPEFRQIHRTPRQSSPRYHWANLPDASGEQLDDISDRILSTSTFTINDSSTPQNLSKSQCTVCPGSSQTRDQGSRRENYLYRDENYVPFEESNALSPFHGIDSIQSDDLSSIHTSREYSFFE